MWGWLKCVLMCVYEVVITDWSMCDRECLFDDFCTIYIERVYFY